MKTEATRRSRDEPADDSLAGVGEAMRRLALGVTTTLIVARAYWPSEDAPNGGGLGWVFALLVAVALAVISWALSASVRLRFSPVDLGFLLLIGMTATASRHAPERRAAINMTWEWVGLGLAYFLLRCLPKDRRETGTIAAIMLASAAALSFYGLYQVPVEYPRLRQTYLANPERVLREAGIDPNSPARKHFEDRAIGSKEPFATFGLPNSFAGYLAGPAAFGLALLLDNVRRRDVGSRLVAMGLAAVPGFALMFCLLLTKSRSAYAGVAAAFVFLAWRSRRAVPRPVLLATAGALLFTIIGLIGFGLATGQLDRQVLTESTKSLRYRWEYWVGTWNLIRHAPVDLDPKSASPLRVGEEQVDDPAPLGIFWAGIGPGNFPGPYLRYKLPESSEEISDPHNMLLDVWVSAGLPSVLVLLAVLGLAFKRLLGAPDEPIASDAKPSDSSGSMLWLTLFGWGGWITVVVLGKLNPFQGDLLARWLILGVGWAVAAGCGGLLWNRTGASVVGLGAAVLAISVNLLAAGGIAIPAVALSLWVFIALGLNLREDIQDGRAREVGGLGAAVIAACVWAAAVGWFWGAIGPFWKSEILIGRGDEAMRLSPRFEEARRAYTAAIEADRYNPRPFLSLAGLEYQFALSPEGRRSKEVLARVTLALDGAVEPPFRNPNSLAVRRLQSQYAREMLRIRYEAEPLEIVLYRGKIVQAARKAARIYPTNPNLRAELAEASAEIGMYHDAIQEAEIALKLSETTPHPDKKLAEPQARYLRDRIPVWKELLEKSAEATGQGK